MRFFQILGWITVLILNSSCGKKQSAPWPASIKFLGLTQSEKSGVTESLKAFSQTLGTEAFFFDDRPTQFQITIGKTIPSKETSNRAGQAIFNESTCSVELNTLIFAESHKDYLKPVLWHELGHCSGMEHNPTSGEIMYYLASTIEYYSTSSIERFMKSFESLTFLRTN